MAIALPVLDWVGDDEAESVCELLVAWETVRETVAVSVALGEVDSLPVGVMLLVAD